MKRNLIIVCLLLVILSACNNDGAIKLHKKMTLPNQSEQNDRRAQVLKVYTDLPQESGWWIVPRDINTMTIFVEAKNVDTVLFWIVPTGTETWGERTLIGYDKDGSDGWSLTWEFDNRTFHDRICIQALGCDGFTQSIETIKVTTVDS